MTRNYVVSLILLTIALQAAAEEKFYPSWLKGQMPDAGHMRAGYNHAQDGFEEAALEKFILASRYGNLSARITVGDAYLKGVGVSQDPIQAWAWFRLAEMTPQTNWTIQSPSNTLWEIMNDSERAQAERILATLRVEHGPDAVEKRIHTWLRRERHKHREYLSRIYIPGAGTVSRADFYRLLESYVLDFYLPETEVRLRELKVIEPTDSSDPPKED